MVRRSVTISLLLIFFLSSMGLEAERIKFRPSKEAWQLADEKLKQMTLDEKIGQLIHIGINAKFLPQDSPEFIALKRQVTENKIGGIIFFMGNVYDTVHLINRMQELADIPLLISADFETGVGMRLENTLVFPWNMAIAATGNTDFARKQGEIIARESKALGVHQVFAPVVDVNNNPENPVINVRSYGEDPKMVAKFAVAFIEGLQSGAVLATAKHFPGHGDTSVDSHRGLPVINVTRKRLEEYEFYPFREAIRAGVASVMVSHISLPRIDDFPVSPLKERYKPTYTDVEVITEGTTIPATLSRRIVTGILKKEMGFDGLIVTDAMNMSGLTIYFNQDEAAVRAIEAGVDVLLMPANVDQVLKGLRQAVASGRISEERINESVRKQLAWKYHLGLHKKKTVSIDDIDKIVSNKEARDFADKIAENAITLVKNEDGILPISADDKRRFFFLAITNSEESDSTIFFRTFRNKKLTTSVRGDLESVDFGLIKPDTNASQISDIRKRIEASDVVIAGFFVRVRSGAKNSIEVPEAGKEIVKQIIENKKLIAISFGNPYILREFPEMKTYIVAYGDMPSLQRATALALFGEIDFRGRLPITIMPGYPSGLGLSIKK
ncbi:MAG: glycoside hydrolase family 3 N-terminal domain-containing protein [Acidobacteriota bacterium]|nr:glycoside hydrolase family 3 protein [Pyrinomonadaceae bacterium]MDW8304781.1 glycoside hydrolase family 3 N-terminal domain-containing protein [Acidobacteriota bacterium]